jgi:hypothetical protein
MKYRRITACLLAVAVLTATATQAEATTLVCSGKVEMLGYHQPGTLYVKLSGMNVPVAICNMDTNWAPAGSVSGTTSISSCKALFAALMFAKQADTNITSMWFDADALPASCTTFASWTQVNLRYFDF